VDHQEMLELARDSVRVRALATSLKESHEADKAIELLALLDAMRDGGGWWYRAKKRAELTTLFFKPR